MELKKYKLGELLSKIENGAVIKQNKGAKGIPITRIETLSNGLFNRDKLGYADIEDPTLYSDYILEDNDLLMSHINSKEFVGRTVIYKKQANECIIHGMNLLRIKTNTKLLDPEFAYYYFQTDTIKTADSLVWVIHRFRLLTLREKENFTIPGIVIFRQAASLLHLLPESVYS